jgi:hypothetical protein
MIANESFNVNKLMRHLKTKHGSLAYLFTIKAEIVKKTRLHSCGSYQRKPVVEASYLLVQRIEKAKNLTEVLV